MNINTLTLRDLEYLVATAAAKHFGKASKACFVSQPALSTQIKKIEDQLGVIIFERTNRKVLITSMGERIVHQAKIILNEASKLGTISSEDENPLEGSLRLGTIASLGPYLVPHLLPPIRKTYPKLKLFFTEGLTADLVSKLRNGEVDAVFAAPTFDSQGLKFFNVFWEPFVLAAPAQHDLAHKKSISVKDLKADEMILLEDGHCLKDQTLDFCSLNRGRQLQEFQATSIETLKHLIGAGIGYSVLPKLATLGHSQLEKILKYRNLEDRVGRQINLYYRENYSRVQELEVLLQFIKTLKIDAVSF